MSTNPSPARVAEIRRYAERARESGRLGAGITAREALDLFAALDAAYAERDYYRAAMQAIRDHAYLSKLRGRIRVEPQEGVVKIEPWEVTRAWERLVDLMQRMSISEIDAAEGQGAVDRRTFAQVLAALPDQQDGLTTDDRGLLSAVVADHSSHDHGWTITPPIGSKEKP